MRVRRVPCRVVWSVHCGVGRPLADSLAVACWVLGFIMCVGCRRGPGGDVPGLITIIQIEIRSIPLKHCVCRF